MRKTRQIEFSKNFAYLGPLNNKQTVFLAQSKEMVRFIIKRIDYGFNMMNMKFSQDNILRKMYASTQPNLLKPQFYSFENNSLYLAQKIYPMSLETLILAHRQERGQISPELVWTFTCKIFDFINKMKQSDFYHQNLKPSNIFLQHIESQIKWIVSQAGLHTNHRNKYYTKVPVVKNNKSVKMQPVEFQYYSLGVMILEMTTLASIDKIQQVIRQKKSMNQIQGLDKAKKDYGTAIIDLAFELLNPKQNLKDYFNSFRDQPPRKGNMSQITLDAYYKLPQTLQKFCKENTITVLESAMKDNIKSRQLNCEDMLDFTKKYDPTYQFCFSQLQQSQSFLSQYGCRLDLDSLILSALYYYDMSKFRYMQIALKIFPTSDVVQAIIRKALQLYNSQKEFFEAQTESKDYWKSQQIRNFLWKLGVNVPQQSISQIIKTWTNDKMRDSIRYKQFHTIFKGTSESLMLSKHSKSLMKGQQSMHVFQNDMKGILQQIKTKVPRKNLVSFFRMYDNKQKWVVGWQIEKQIRKYTTVNNIIFKSACEEMWKKAGIPGQTGGNKKLRYIYLLKALQIYDLVELFRLVITEKINETDRQRFFQTYKKGQGWSVYSLLQFNNDQMLEFQQREINIIFKQMDRDNTGIIEQKQLVYKLTGLKEFDQQFIINQIKDTIKSKRIDFFEVFLRYDPSKNFFLQTQKDLIKVFEDIGYDIPPNHCQILYRKFQRNYRFEYLMFLRYFYSCKEIFIKACLLIVHHQFRGDLDKLFNIGLHNNQRKWNRKSISAVNDELVLGFSDMEVGKIWDQLDPQGDGSLTKKQIGQLFSIQAQEDDEFKASKVPSFIKPVLEEQIYDKKKDNLKGDLLGNLMGVNAVSAVGSLVKRTIEQAVIQQVNKNNLLKSLKDSDCLNSLKIFYKKSDYAGWLSFDKFAQCLKDMGIRLYQKQLKNGVQKFSYVDDRTREQRVNYVKLLLFLSEFSDNPDETKGRIIIDIFKWVRKDKKYSIAQIFKMCRRSQRMKLSDFENIFKQIVGVQVFYQDFEEAWKLWGDQQYITPQDLQADTVELSSVVKKQFSFNSKDLSRQRGGTTIIDERRDRNIGRKQSTQSKNQYEKNIKKINSRELDKKTPDAFLPIDSGERYGNRKNYQRNEQEKYRNRRQSDDKYGNKKYDTYENRKQQQQRNRKDSNDRREDQRYRRDSRDRKEQQRHRRDSHDKREQERYRRDSRERQDKKRSIQRDNQQRYRRNEEEKRPYKRYQNEKQQQNDKKGRSSIGQAAQNNKNYLLNLLIGKINDKGNTKINQLFSQSTLISDKIFIKCLVDNYEIDQTEAEQISQILSTFQKIKIQSLKKVLGSQKQSSPSAPARKLKGNEKSPKKKTQFRLDTEQPRYDKRLKDPKKNRVNIPMVKQHIKILVTTFCKKFDRAQLQHYFFEGNEEIDREIFIKKCEGINPSISRNMLDKIFQYAKPKGETINTISFGIAFSFDETIEIDETYLPQQLNNQIKDIFEKFDKDKSGHIDIAEVQQLLNSLGYNETQKEIQNCFMQIDKNHDNKIEFHEFRTFIEENVLTQITSFDDQIDNLLNILQMNDIFNTGFLSMSTLQAVLIRYGIKVNERQIRNLCKVIGNEEQEISIKDFIQAVNFPSYEIFPTSVKALLYRIRWKKKITLKDIRKVFQSMSSSNFLLSYSSQVMKKKIIKYSTLHEPILHQSGFFYIDFPYKNIRNISQTQANLIQETVTKDMLIQIKVQQACGLPIPQTSIKNQIRRRYVNIAFYDSSSQNLKYAVCFLEAYWDADVQDQWLFDKVNRSIFIKIGQFEARKYQRISILFEFIITIVQEGREIDISCGYANLPVKQLLGIDGRINKRLKLHAGIPNKSRQIDKTSVSKRNGWLPFMGRGDIESEVDLQINGPSRFTNKIPFLASLPTHSIVNRKIIHYVWSFRQYFATKSFNGTRVNPNFSNNFKTKLYLLSFDIPAIQIQIIKFWKDRVENHCTTPAKSRQVLDIFLQQLYQVVYSKQFDYKPSIANHSVLYNSTLHNLRFKMVEEVFDNIYNWLRNYPSEQYSRKKPYSTEFLPFKIEQREIRSQDLAILKIITNYQAKA